MLSKSIISAIALCAGAVNAHISLTEPIPYGKPDTSPLSPAGANYPCKTENGFKVNSVTKMTVGSSQKMAFSGSAVHGGGSCQISLATGHTPTGSSQFKVIYSIMGGCPGTDSSTVNYDFKVPAEVPAGEYTLAWTWFNRIGNREMYMNCAPITVDGGSGSESTFSALPDMAIYNIASKNACKTTEGTDVAFPNPGKYVLTGPGNKPGPPAGCGAATASSSSGSDIAPAAAPASGTSNSGASPAGSANTGQYTGVGSSAGNSGAAPAAASSPASAASSAPKAAGSSAPKKKGSASSASSPSVATPAASAPSSAASGSTGTFAEGSTSNGTTGGTTNGTGSGSDGSAASSAAPASLSIPSPAAVPVTPVTPASSDGGACSVDGAVVCSSDGSSFGLCNFGKAVMMPVAAGTKCAGGQIMRRRVFTS